MSVWIADDEAGTHVPDLYVEDAKPLKTELKGPDGEPLWWVPARIGFHNPRGEQPYDLLPY